MDLLESRVVPRYLPLVVGAAGYLYYARGPKSALMSLLRDAASTYLAAAAERHRIPSDVLRQLFNDQPLVRVHRAPEGTHTHADSAARRSTGSATATAYARSCGLEPYFHQMSLSDLRHNHAGSRAYYWAKDVQVPPSTDGYDSKRDLCILIDVDYYLDMPLFLTRVKGPILLYTLVPAQAGILTQEYSVHFENNLAVTIVSGGASYRHPLWDYGADTIMVTNVDVLEHTTSIFLVDRKQVDDHHQLVLFTPVARYTGAASICAVVALGGTSLERLRPNPGDGWSVLQTRGGKHAPYVSIAREGSPVCVDVALDVYQNLLSAAAISTQRATAALAESYTGQRAGAALLAEYLRHAIPSHIPVVFPVAESVRAYQYNPQGYDPDAKQKLVAFMAPLVHAAFSPDSCRSNDVECVLARIKEVASTAQPTSRDLELMDEFWERVIPHAHKLVPVDLDEVYERQARPTQRAIIEAAVTAGPFIQRLIKAFQKAEAYPEPKSPRNISTINPQDKVEYSRYMYAFAAVLKSAPWYAFALTPAEVAARVVQVCRNAQTVSLTDYNKLDGRISPLFRELERRGLLRAFEQRYHADLLAIQRSQFNLVGRTEHGIRYQQRTSRASGSAETSGANTVDNAFVAYKTFRTMRSPSGDHYSPDEAYAMLGVYGGDDGATGDVDIAIYEECAAQCGQKLTAKVVRRGGRGVQFLSRVFGPQVWYGDPSSMCDVPRQLAKLHVCKRLPPDVSATRKLAERLRGFQLTDAKTPFIGDLVHHAIRLGLFGEPSVPGDHELANWFSGHSADVQFPNDVGDWALSYIAEVAPDLSRGILLQALQRCTGPADLLNLPLIAEPKRAARQKRPVVVDGAVLDAQPLRPATAAPDRRPESDQGSSSQPVIRGLHHTDSGEPAVTFGGDSEDESI